ncbi:hypothetical protein WG902_04630 [Ramlibacter sp. PS3R-8]|uniref:hypothetical protein n=1 Tax=Ramlibacter sp. PS3R-8 TaxID=3133437 RepID=UPI0030AE9E9A
MHFGIRLGAARRLMAADEPTPAELLLIACELAVRVESRPERRDGTDAAVYASSGRTLARRIQAGTECAASCNETPLASDQAPAPFCWDVSLRVGAARRTNYKVWLREDQGQLQAIWMARAKARQLRDRLPHDQRKKKPWGPL